MLSKKSVHFVLRSGVIICGLLPITQLLTHAKGSSQPKKQTPALQKTRHAPSNLRGQVELAISGPRQRVLPGHAVNIKAIVTNNSDAVWFYYEWIKELDFNVIARDRHGKDWPRTRFGKPDIGARWKNIHRSLKPGESREFTFAVNRVIDMSMSDRYRIRLERTFTKKGMNGEVESIAVLSNALEIVVDETATGN